MKTIKTLLVAATFAAIGAAGTAALAQVTKDPSKPGDPRSAGGSADEMTNAEVRKVDKEQGKVTLRHGPIKNLNMPGMTMVFAVKDKSMLDKVKPGDKVRFRATDEGGRLTMTEMMPAN